MSGKQNRTALDSSCLIALLCGWHVHHARTLRSYEGLTMRGVEIVLPAHTVLECYSVLTRIPPPHRLSPGAVRQMLDENFSRSAAIAAVHPAEVWKAVDSLFNLGLGGGRVYDAVIAHCALAAGATVLLTWNVKHFASIAPAGLDVREP